MKPVFAWFAAVSLGLVVAAPAGAEHVCRYCQAAAAGAKAAHAPKYAPDRVVDVRHLRIEVTPNFAAKTIRATTTIDFAPISETTRTVELNAVRLRIESVTATRTLAEHSTTDDTLTLLFEEPIPVGEEVSVAITYIAEPKKGLYFRTADMGYPEGEDHVWSQGETHEAPHWFPCFDYPNERSTTEVICHVPADMTVLSNGTRLGSTTDAETGLKKVHWRQDKPHVNYLVCLCAGHFAKLAGESNGVPLGFYTQPSVAKEAANSFQDTAAILAFYEEEIGVKYPWAKYDQVTILDYYWGGMENTSLTTLTNETVFDESTENIRSSRGLDAHELAHQWFGDYVTCKDWSHLWLNEGFATFYTHLYNGHKLGRDEMLYGLYRDATERVLPGSKKNASPIVWRRYDKPWDQFDFRAYPKGSWVLHMLRSRLGEDVYRRAIRLYLERHALSSVVTDDLRQALEEVSGKPLDAFFDQWVYHGGVPHLEVTHKWIAEDKLLRVTVKQDEPEDDKTLLFTFPVMLRAHVGEETVDRQVEIAKAEQDFYLSLPGKPDVVRFDPEFTLLAQIDHKQSQEMLEAQLQLEGDLIGRLRAAKGLGEKDQRVATKALANALANDGYYGVRIAASKALAKQGSPAALKALLANRQQADARVRLQVVKSLGKFFYHAAAEALRTVAASEANPEIRGAALSGLAKYPGQKFAGPLVESLHAESFRNQIVIAAAKAIGSRRDAALAPALIEALTKRRFELPGRRYREALKALGQVAREADDKSAAYDFLCGCLADPVEAVQLGAIEGLGELRDQRAKAILEDYAEVTGKIGPAAKEALERLEAEPQKTPQSVKDLRSQFRELREQQKELAESLELLEAKAAPKQVKGKGKAKEKKSKD